MKRQLLKTLITLAVAIVAMLLFRAAVVTVCCVEGDALQPVFLAGDRVLVNRWSYGLRTGGPLSRASLGMSFIFATKRRRLWSLGVNERGHVGVYFSTARL